MLNKQKGNMYGWVTHTWNPIRGKCPHDCSYCYMKGFWKIQKSKKQILDKKALEDELGENKFIFVGSSTDMWAEDVPDDWIKEVLRICKYYDKNKYLFQTKNPKRFWDFNASLPENVILGTTLESDRSYKILSKAPIPEERSGSLSSLSRHFPTTMVSIEPLLNFNSEPFVNMIRKINPKFVSIGADSKGHNLPEPSKEKVEALIKELKKFTKVKIKPNLNRLIK